MGEKEQTIISDFKFEFSTIFKPGFLKRKPKNRSNFPLKYKYSLPVDILAKAMIFDAENVYKKTVKNNIHYLIGNKSILNSVAVSS